MAKREFEITLRVKVEAHSLDTARTIANGIVDDLERCGQEYIDRPINYVRWSRISPVFEHGEELATSEAIAYRDQPNDVDLCDAIDAAVDAVNIAMDQGEAATPPSDQTVEVAAASLDFKSGD